MAQYVEQATKKAYGYSEKVQSTPGVGEDVASFFGDAATLLDGVLGGSSVLQSNLQAKLSIGALNFIAGQLGAKVGESTTYCL